MSSFGPGSVILSRLTRNSRVHDDRTASTCDEYSYKVMIKLIVCTGRLQQELYLHYSVAMVQPHEPFERILERIVEDLSGQTAVI